MRYFFLLLLCSTFSTSLAAQAKPKTVDLKKGQVFDIIFLTNDPAAKDLMQDYFKRAFPIAQANGYTSGGGFGIAGTPIRGNYHPEVMAIGTWPGLAERTAGLAALETQMDDFHEMRRKIWPTFNLTYYEMKEAASFTIKTEKYYVVTAFWAEQKGRFKKFLKQWEVTQAKAGGTPLLVLTDGTSPFGYNFEPDYFTITEWKSEAAFLRSLPEDNKRGYPGVRHLNQFPIK
ncbi:MAG: hypothetical protein AB8H12_15710 [Lewinella sp.]